MYIYIYICIYIYIHTHFVSQSEMVILLPSRYSVLSAKLAMSFSYILRNCSCYCLHFTL
jgi:hypothetical protein